MGIGVAIAVIGALTLLAAASSFLPHILKTPKHTRVLGTLQLLAGKYAFKFSHLTTLDSVIRIDRVSSYSHPKYNYTLESRL